MITLQTAENALKTVYLGVIGNQLNIGANPLLTKIKQTSNNIYGNEIRKATSYGISGGVSAGSEDGDLPIANSKQYITFTSTLKNLFGTIEISDKAIRCSQNSAGAFVNLLNDEMESLIKSSAFNLGRMLYGDGRSVLATFNGEVATTDTEVIVDSVRNLMENMTINVTNPGCVYYMPIDPFVILSIDRANKKVKLNRAAGFNYNTYHMTTLTGLNKEITGLGKIFATTGTLYGVDKATNPWMIPYSKGSVGTLSETVMQEAIDSVEESTGAEIDYIACSSAVRRAYQDGLNTYRRNVDIMNLQGGFKAISYNGIPLVNDRFVEDDTMYLLSTKNFELCQLCDWEWLENNDGRIIKQKEGKPVYTATLVKYAELLCDRPNAQAKLSGITIS